MPRLAVPAVKLCNGTVEGEDGIVIPIDFKVPQSRRASRPDRHDRTPLPPDHMIQYDGIG